MAGTRANRDRTFAVLNALLNLGPGIHKFRTIAARAGLGDATVHRRLDQLVHAGLATRTTRGYYELCEATTSISRTSGLFHRNATPLLDAQRLLDALHHRTDQVVLLHTHSPLTGERLCIGAAGETSLPSAASSRWHPARWTHYARHLLIWTPQGWSCWPTW
ncbi:helix-turn-helix domain-containing protein [Streptomyces zhihengii]